MESPLLGRADTLKRTEGAVTLVKSLEEEERGEWQESEEEEVEGVGEGRRMGEGPEPQTPTRGIPQLMAQSGDEGEEPEARAGGQRGEEGLRIIRWQRGQTRGEETYGCRADEEEGVSEGSGPQSGGGLEREGPPGDEVVDIQSRSEDEGEEDLQRGGVSLQDIKSQDPRGEDRWPHEGVGSPNQEGDETMAKVIKETDQEVALERGLLVEKKGCEREQESEEHRELHSLRIPHF